MLGALGLVFGASIAADPFVVAALKPAPNVLPVEDEGNTSDQPPAELREMHPARMAIVRNPIHDESNPEYHRLQKLDDAMLGVKRDAAGFPDWMMALRSGAIAPRAGLSPDERMSTFDLNIVMTNTREMPNVLFPHLSHTLWLDCVNCHPYPFLPKAGANQITMSEIFRGKYCGMCHDRVAFITFFSCDRCHSVSHAVTERKREPK
ncbi:MAG: hypothetical protein HZB40_01600 [Rhodocyclales bacterium]|nr:hypothetical protein [Rhodocyclales bacterium]